MHITVFGASGKVGRLVVADLLGKGYSVTAFIHRTNLFADNPKLRIVCGSISDDTAVEQAVQGSQVVISTLGSWGTASKNVVSTGTQAIVTAMNKRKVRRLITLTGAGAFAGSDNPTALDKVTHTFLGAVAGKILKDGEQHLKILESNELDWTCIRSPAMTNSRRDKYILSGRLPSLLAFVPRQAVVRCIVDQVTATNQIKKAPVIYRA